jgi:hypothetical protein
MGTSTIFQAPTPGLNFPGNDLTTRSASLPNNGWEDKGEHDFAAQPLWSARDYVAAF